MPPGRTLGPARALTGLVRRASGRAGAENQRWDHVSCVVRSYTSRLSPWYILGKIGVPKGPIIKFRRGLMRVHYPWIAYCLPAGFIMLMGDYLAQTYEQKCCGQGDSYDFQRMALFALTGFLLVGPLVWRWDRVMCRKLLSQAKAQALVSKLVLDLFVLSPVMLALVLLVNDYKYILDKGLDENSWRDKYRDPFMDILRVNFMTRPLMVLAMAFLLPCAMRRHARFFYEILLAAYASDRLALANAPKNSGSQQKQHSKLCGWIRWLCTTLGANCSCCAVKS